MWCLAPLGMLTSQIAPPHLAMCQQPSRLLSRQQSAVKAEIRAQLVIDGRNQDVSKCEREIRHLFPNASCRYLDEASLDKLKGQQSLLLKSLRQDRQVFGDMTVICQMHDSQHLICW